MSRPTCDGTTKAGTRCASFVAVGRQWCFPHDPANAERMKQARAEGASKGGKVRAIQGRRRRLDSPSAVVAFLSNLVYDVAEGRQDADTAKTLSYALSVQLKAIDLSRQIDVEQALQEVRALVAEARRRRA
jgi:hypothetical protein